MFEVSPNGPPTGAQPSTPLLDCLVNDCLVNDMLLQTRPRSSHAAEDRIPREFHINSNISKPKQLIREFCHKGWDVKSFNKFLKKLRDSGPMTKRKGSGLRPVRALMCCYFTRYSTNIYDETW